MNIPYGPSFLDFVVSNSNYLKERLKVRANLFAYFPQRSLPSFHYIHYFFQGFNCPFASFS
jgi:hypothetical protein